MLSYSLREIRRNGVGPSWPGWQSDPSVMTWTPAGGGRLLPGGGLAIWAPPPLPHANMPSNGTNAKALDVRVPGTGKHPG